MFAVSACGTTSDVWSLPSGTCHSSTLAEKSECVDTRKRYATVLGVPVRVALVTVSVGWVLDTRLLSMGETGLGESNVTGADDPPPPFLSVSVPDTGPRQVVPL